MKPLILSSKSPRRRELLELCGFDFSVIPAELDEGAISKKFVEEGICTAPEDLVLNLAEEKALWVYQRNPDNVVLGADTIVWLEGRVFGKPRTSSEALMMLKALSGRDHWVYTGVSILQTEHKYLFVQRSKVRFYPWDEAMQNLASAYIQSGEPFDKAGGYGIQGMGALFIESLEGDYYSVMGLPIGQVYRVLTQIFK